MLAATLIVIVLSIQDPTPTDLAGGWELCLSKQGREEKTCGSITIDSVMQNVQPNTPFYQAGARATHDIALERVIGKPGSQLGRNGTLLFGPYGRVFIWLGLQEGVFFGQNTGALLADLSLYDDAMYGSWNRSCLPVCSDWGRVSLRRPHYEPPSRSSVRGRIYDTLTSRPILHSMVCAKYYSPRYGKTNRCVSVDTLGWFTLDSLTPGPNWLRAYCSGQRYVDGRMLDTLLITLSPDEEVPLDIRSAIGSCDPRPLRVVHVTIAGHYYSGFEHSEFVPCPASEWRMASDTLASGELKGAWVSWPAAGRVPGEPSKRPPPKVIKKPYYLSEYFMRWSGILRGPGQYGHMGVSAYDFVPDSIIERRTPGEGDCNTTE